MNLPSQQNHAQELELKLRQIRERSQSRPQTLPHWNENVCGIPNLILRSALFTATSRQKHLLLERVRIESLSGFQMIYTGARLDQSDLDVWIGVLKISQHQHLGAPIEFVDKHFLKMIGRGGEHGKNIGSSDIFWLRKILARLSATNIEIVRQDLVYAGSLINDYVFEPRPKKYYLSLNPKISTLFLEDQWTGVDWRIRKSLFKFPLALWLHGFYSSHANPFRFKIGTLHRLCGCGTGKNAHTPSEQRKALLDWRRSTLEDALNKVKVCSQHHGKSFHWEIHDELVEVTHSPPPSQRCKPSAQKFKQNTQKSGG